MPLEIASDLPTKFPNPQYLTLENFKRGVITLIDKSRLPKDALEEANNIFLVEDGQPSPRPGVDWFGVVMPSVRKGAATVTTNLVTNPTLEVDTAGWALGGTAGAAIARSTAEFYAGIASLKFTSSTALGNQQATITLTGLTIGLQYTIQAKVKGTVGQRVFGFSGLSGYSDYNEITLVSGWNTISWTATATATSGTIEFGNFYVGDVYIDTVMAQVGSVASTYFDGTTTSTGSTDYAWTGTSHASTSTQSVYLYEPYAIDGFDYFDFAGVIHLVAVAGGVVYRSTNDGATWTACTGATLTIGTVCYFNQYNNLLYITNGTNNMTLYDGTTVLTQYVALTTPVAPTIVETGLAGTGNQYYYKCSRVNTIGFSIASTASAIVQSTLARESWDSTTNFATLTLPAFDATQTRYDIYVSEDNLNFYYLDSTSSVTYVDNGRALASPSTIAPTADTSQGPKMAELTNVGSRMYGVRDPNNRYRIWFSSGQTPKGAFSSAYDGGYLDWQNGGKYMPVKVADYRDGKGTPLATVWCKSADGQGCILQMSLDTLTVGTISITVPSAYRLPGSRGTPASGSVVNVLNDFMFYNQQAFYNLGSRAQFLNLLSTDESSANIRPTVKQISQSGESKIASVYYDAKVYFSVPYGSTTNNYTIIYDTERKAWLPKAFTLGFSNFLRYTDTTGVSHLLALKPGDTRLSEISSAIQGDYGAAFATSLTTGLYPTTKNRFEFQFTEEAEVEFSNPQGTIAVELIGIERSQGFSSIKSQSITTGGTPYGWDYFLEDTTLWDDTTLVSDPFSESTVKRYWPLLKELNAIQWRVTTNSLDAAYVLRTLQTWGTETQGGKPRSWRIT